ncbi:MAG: hypothetical protein Q7R35_04535 [Elusimicrobiota bacterium]|nr:hypothetical protein [Elusimicrobiota bacterium]
MTPRAKALLGWTWLALAVPAGIAVVLYSNPLGAALADRAGIRVSPHFSGGETAAVIDHGAYRTVVRRPVFDALLWEWSTGFVQVGWEPADALPGRLRDEIDLFGNGARGFYINLDTATGAASYENPPGWVIAGPKAERLRNSWVIRVRVKNPDKKAKRQQ